MLSYLDHEGDIFNGILRPSDWLHIEQFSISDDCDTLIIVPGHALLRTGTDIASSDFDPRNVCFWSLNEFQTPDELGLILDHIRMGVLKLTENSYSVLCFSGACTRAHGYGWTEGESYYVAAHYFSWWKHETNLSLDALYQRVFVDVFALDSFENLWIPICSFLRMHPHSRVPSKVFVVNYAFKRELYQRHAAFLGIPFFEYVGLENPSNLDQSVDAKIDALISAYNDDPYGENLYSDIVHKRSQRNVLRVHYPYGTARDVQQAYNTQF